MGPDEFRNLPRYEVLPGEHRSTSEESRTDAAYRPMLVRVIAVDYERKSLTVRDAGNDAIFENVRSFPAFSSSPVDTDVQMPEIGAAGIALNLMWQGGHANLTIVQWVLSDTNDGLLALATRMVPTLKPQMRMAGPGSRVRGVYRKAYPGERTVTNRHGFTSRIDGGWDHQAADLSRDRVDPMRRQRTQITSRSLSYTDAGFSVHGPIHRPDAPNVKEQTLPDGSKVQTVFLAQGKELRDRYFSGTQDVIPLVESLERVQEFALDFPLPLEVLETDVVDDLLGSKQPLWQRTSVKNLDGVSYDDQSKLISQRSDHPHDVTLKPLGPTTNEGPTPRRRAYVMERVIGTLVGYNRQDKSTYGKILKPQLFAPTRSGRFSTEPSFSYNEVADSADHVETLLAATAFSLRFPAEYNGTRIDVTKEGLVLAEIGATIPKENIGWDPGTYEHPHGAGRSLELHSVGSIKTVIGKNRDEEESLDLTTLGQVVMRLGSDDASLPNADRSVQMQVRGEGDAVGARKLQYWSSPKAKPGDAGDLENKTGMEQISLRAATDGGVVLRLGARNPNARRRHLKNGYMDGQGRVPGGANSRTSGRPTYGAGDSNYQFHDLKQVGAPQTKNPTLTPYAWSGDPIINSDLHGRSLDLHACEDIFARIGRNSLSGQSLSLDLGGGVVAAIGTDTKRRSMTMALDGGIEATIGTAESGYGLQVEIQGDVAIVVKGNYTVHASGDIVMEANGNMFSLARFENIMKGLNIRQGAMVQHVSEAPDIVHNQGAYSA